MSIKIMTRAWDVPLPHADKLLLLALSDNANDEGLCWPGVATLGRKCGMDDRTVQRAVKRLADAGHVTVLGIREHKSNDYLVHPQTPGAAPPPAERHSGTTPRGSGATPPVIPGTAPPHPRQAATGGEAQRHPNLQGSVREPQSNPPVPPPQTEVGADSRKPRRSPERRARDASRMAWLHLVQTLGAVMATNGRETWADAERRVRDADPVAHAAVLALGGYAVIGRSQRREELYLRPFRQTYVRAVMGGAP
jgi:hypothetical protein